MTTPSVGELEVEVVASFRRLAKQLETRLAAINRSHAIELRVKLKNRTLASLNRTLKSYTGVNALTKSFESASGKIQFFLNNISLVSRMLVILGAAIGPLVVAIGGLSVAFSVLGQAAVGALAALPGLFAGAAAGVFVFKTAFADAGKVLGKSLSQFGDIKKIISKNFWAEATEGTKAFLNSAIGPLKKGFGQLSTSAGGFLGKLGEQFSKALTPAVYSKFFGGLSSAFDIMGERFSGPFASIIAKLLTFSSTIFPQIANGLANITIKFDNFLKRNPDFLIDSWNAFVGVIRGVFSVVAGLVSIFQGLATAALDAGIGAGNLGSGLKGIADNIKNSQAGLTEFFRNAKEGMAGLGVALGPLGKLFGSLGPIIGTFIKDSGIVLGDFFGKLFTSINRPEVLANLSKAFELFPKVFSNLIPAIDPIVQKFGELLAFGGLLADQFSKTLATAIQVIVPVFTALLEPLAGLTKALGEFFRAQLERMAPQLAQIGKMFGELVVAAKEFIEALDTPVLKFILSLITDFFVTAVKGAINLVTGILKIVTGLAKVLSGDFSGFSDIFGGIGKAIKGAFQLFITLFAPAKILGAIGRLAGKIINSIGPLGVKLVTKLGTTVAKEGPSIGRSLIEGIIKGAATLIGGFLSKLAGWIIGGVKSLFGISSPSTVFAEIGGFLVQGLIAGIQALIGGVAALFGAPVEAIKAIFVGAFNLIVGAGKLLWEGLTIYFNIFKTAITIGINVVKTVVSAVWNVLKTVGSAVWGPISKVFNVMKTAITVGISTMKTIVTGAWNGIKAVGSAIWSPISSGFNKMKDALTSGVSKIKGAFTGAFDGIKNVVRGALNFIIRGWNKLDFKIPGFKKKIFGKEIGFDGFTLGLPDIPELAIGTRNFRGGLAVVGEKGPELVKLPKGSDVFTNKDSRGLLRNAAQAPDSVAAMKRPIELKVINYYPQSEPTSVTTNKTLQRAALLGLV